MSEHRYAEKLTLLCEHAQALLVRLHRVKQVRVCRAAMAICAFSLQINAKLAIHEKKKMSDV